MVTDHLKNIGKAVLLFLVVWFTAFCCKAQNVVRKDKKTFVELTDSTKKQAPKVQETDMIYVDKNKNAYPIYLSSNGKAFILMTSKKTGKQYRKYLPKVTEMLQYK